LRKSRHVKREKDRKKSEISWPGRDGHGKEKENGWTTNLDVHERETDEKQSQKKKESNFWSKTTIRSVHQVL
jgi:hypothetical protein